MASDPWLTPPQLAAWVRLAAVLELLPGAMDGQLRRDSDLLMFEYLVLAMLSEAPDRRLRMAVLAQETNSTPPRLSHVVRRLEERGLVERTASAGDRRSTNAQLTEQGWKVVQEAAPGHAANVRRLVMDSLSEPEVAQLAAIMDKVLARIDPDGAMAAMYTRYDG